ncbi:MAG TPA: hypothetical protein VFL66_08730 [Gaiellaceae bacterium]|nr:hypothetical protein [Gaiellaceae bacterium]
MSGWIPKPPELAERIALDTSARVRPDEAELREATAGRLGEDSGGIVGAEGAARDVVREAWTPELTGEVAQALAAVREQYLGAAETVRQAIEDIVERGPDAWAARAVRAQLAFRVSWAVLDERGELLEL